MTEKTQPTQLSFDSKTILKRWYVTTTRRQKATIVTWAEDESAARMKAEQRGLTVTRVEPALKGLGQ